MLGFTVPLFIFLGLEALLALLLLAPLPLARSAIVLCKGSRTSVGSTIVGTVTAFLLVGLAAPVYDLTTLRRYSEDAVYRGRSYGEAEANANLNLVMTLTCLVLLYVLRKLGQTLGEKEQMRVSQQAVLKQVKGLQDEYSRLLKEQDTGQGGAGTSSEVATLRARNNRLQQEHSELKLKAAAADKARRAAENNAEALKSQAKGLENEYDRLLSEMDSLKRRLSVADPSYTEGLSYNKKD